MANYINPVDRVAGYRNQELGRVSSGLGARVDVPASAGLGVGAQERLRAGQASDRALEGLQSLSSGASRQHQLRLAAIRKSLTPTSDGISPSYGGTAAIGSKYGGKGLVGPHKLISGAANAMEAMKRDYKKSTGQNLPILWGGRTYEEQARLYALYKAGKGNLAAPPGKSEHNKGRAVDFGGANSTNTRVFRWLQQNAAKYGFKWTGKNFSQLEPWHWEWFG